MKLPTESTTYLTKDLKICRILNGMWQVSGAHGYIDKQKAIEAMDIHVESGFITWDLADHYGPSEDFVKEFRNSRMKEHGEDSLKDIRFFTKWVPRPQPITKQVVSDAIDVSRKRMGMKTLDMLQFHWWEYENKNYLKAVEYLDELREEETIYTLGLTNFDSTHVEEFMEMGIKITSNQVQYSLIDRRPEKFMADMCSKYGIKLFAYGTLCGGLLSERFIGKPEPFRTQLNTASLSKYKNMINRWGDWDLFQELLNVLKQIADNHNVSIANVAVRYVLENPIVAGAIIGVRLGVSEHIIENSRVFDFKLGYDEKNEIESVLSNANNLIEIIGDCGDEYRY
ncbi:MAG: aldo/keto reductase [Promethearchaeota archaeon]|jgi:aryl-alcohol dehydrogenase-like predicted oxidoreductase